MNGGNWIGALIFILIIGPFVIGMWVLLFVGLRNFVRRYW